MIPRDPWFFTGQASRYGAKSRTPEQSEEYILRAFIKRNKRCERNLELLERGAFRQ